MEVYNPRLEYISNLISSPLGILFLISHLIIVISCVALVLMIFTNFMISQEKRAEAKEEKSLVETFSMSMFFIACTFLINARIGNFKIANLNFEVWIVFIGALIVLKSTIINIIGRFNLKLNWANQVVIYKNQTMVSNGVYKFVRHPLYFSLITLLIGLGLAYSNYLVIVLDIIVFLPAMYYRAKQEEKLLVERFGETYLNYQRRTGMLFPVKLW